MRGRWQSTSWQSCATSAAPLRQTIVLRRAAVRMWGSLGQSAGRGLEEKGVGAVADQGPITWGQHNHVAFRVAGLLMMGGSWC